MEHPSVRLQLVERAAGEVEGDFPLPAKVLAEAEGVRLLIIQMPNADPASVEAMAQQISKFPGMSRTLIFPVEDMNTVREYEFRLNLPSPDDPVAIDYFAAASHEGWRRQKVANGFQDHPFVYGYEINATGQILCEKCRRIKEQHHPDMRPFAELPEANANLGREAAREFLRALAAWPGEKA